MTLSLDSHRHRQIIYSRLRVQNTHQRSRLPFKFMTRDKFIPVPVLMPRPPNICTPRHSLPSQPNPHCHHSLAPLGYRRHNYEYKYQLMGVPAARQKVLRLSFQDLPLAVWQVQNRFQLKFWQHFYFYWIRRLSLRGEFLIRNTITWHATCS